MVKYVKKNLDIANKFCQSLGPSLYLGSTVPRKVTTHLCHFRDFIFTMPDQVRNTYAELPYKLVNEEVKGGRGGGTFLLPWSETVAPKSNQMVRRRGIDW